MFGERVFQQTVDIPMGTMGTVLIFSPTCSFIRMIQISHISTERYILTNVGVSGMLLHINGKIEIISFAVQFSSYLALIVNFEVYVKA
jgi:hypothetical protein